MENPNDTETRFKSFKSSNTFSDDELLKLLKYDDSDFLPYIRKYTTLTQDDLLILINQAKEQKWQALDLSNCGLTELPPEIGILIDLKVLHLGNDLRKIENINLITELPPSIGKLNNLIGLSLYNSKISQFPAQFSNLKKLKHLNLNGSEFSSFPEVILNCANLEVLALGIEHYQIEIPDTIDTLKNLKSLCFPNGNINTLPNSTGNLKNLKEIYMQESQISNIPPSLSKLNNLEKLCIHDTPLTSQISPEILDQTPIEVINYIIKFQSDIKKIILNESKMIIVGQGGVGKTCVLKRIVENDYSDQLSTEGIDITVWNFESDTTNCNLNIWDFGGQEIYHATHQFFLTKRSLYLFVWDSRQEEEYGRIDYWLNTIQTFADDSPILIIVNKCDKDRKNTKEIDIINIQKRFSQVVGIHYISCQDGLGIDDLKNSIIDKAVNLPLMRTIWISSWINVREELENLSQRQNIISYEMYINICYKYDITSTEALSLIKYLHDLGVVLHFHDDVLLKNIVILSPEWGTEAVYKVLDAQNGILKNRNGILYYHDLPKIWKDNEKYPPSTYQYILKLMARFQLSFVVKDNEEFLVAELLENKERKLDLIFNRDKTLNFRYIYDFLPAGIMTRFIVNANEYLCTDAISKVCWLKGAYLEYKDSYALVELFDGITERYVNINVSGGNRRNRSELLQIIRIHFENIHKSISKIKCTEKVLCNCSETCNYLHDYKYLLRLENESIQKERCKSSLVEINVFELLDGFSTKETRSKNMEQIKIDFRPTINAFATATATNQNEISLEIKNSVNELQGHINDLKDEIIEQIPDFENYYNKMQKSITLLDKAETKDEIVKSGALSKIKRFIDDYSDPTSNTGKALSTIKHGFSILKDIAKTYNSIAEWCGMPVVPKLFLKSDDE